jgi:hypothetical protein
LSTNTQIAGAEWHSRLWSFLFGLSPSLRQAPGRDALLKQIIKGVTHQKRARVLQNPLESLFAASSLLLSSREAKSIPSSVSPSMDLGLTNVTADFFGDATASQGPNSLRARCEALTASSNRIANASVRVIQFAQALEKQKWQHQLQTDFHLLEKDIQVAIDDTVRHLDATNERFTHTNSTLDRYHDNKRTELSSYGGSEAEYQQKHNELSTRRAQLVVELQRVNNELEALVARHERSKLSMDQITQKWSLSTSKLESELETYRNQTENLTRDREAAGAIHHHVVAVYENLTKILADNIKRASQQSFKSLSDYIVQVREHVLQVQGNVPLWSSQPCVALILIELLYVVCTSLRCVSRIIRSYAILS